MPDLKYSNETAFLLEQFFVQSISYATVESDFAI